ncbi:MAG TPA: hypothetical protein G4O15_16160 [Dehalococcoidia bacterium]|nr:hypothetical protein [Dehalococcoidia bacterium]
MTRKLRAYSGLLVLVLALTGFGIWSVFNSGNKVKIPEEEPVVLVDFNNPENGTFSQLSIYEDGTVIYVEDSELEMPVQQGDEYIRTWRTGRLDSEEIEYFFSILDSVAFFELGSTVIFTRSDMTEEEEYVPEEMPKPTGPSLYPGRPIEYIRMFVDNGQKENTIVVIGYVSTGAAAIQALHDEPDFSFKHIYAELADVIVNKNEKIMVKELTK